MKEDEGKESIMKACHTHTALMLVQQPAEVSVFQLYVSSVGLRANYSFAGSWKRPVRRMPSECENLS